ncbi:MAG: hypothetical protein R2712_29505 [Vicinamibacterales bacterium]
MKEHFDLVHILQRDWEKGLGAKLEGKLHLCVGDMDNYYLNDAVYLAEQYLETTRAPTTAARCNRRPRRALLERRPHPAECAVAAPLSPDVHPAVGRAHGQTAPAGADLKSWRY